MNYTDIVNTALTYADRSDDTDLVNLIPSIVPIVEARINKVLSTYNMSTEYASPMGSGSFEFSLPSGFDGVNTIKIRNISTGSISKVLTRIPADALYTLQANSISQDLYTIENNKIIVLTEETDEYELVLNFTQSVPSLYANSTNWLADLHCDCYIFGIVAEIYSYVKNKEGFESWNTRFNESLTNIQVNADKDEWNGAPLVIRMG